MVVEEGSLVVDPVEDSLVEDSPAAAEARNSGEGAARNFEAVVARNPAEVGSPHGLVLERTTSSGAQVGPNGPVQASW